jgi:1,4-dihydroxy-2-naphthoyl-CoA hydrolase
VSGLGESVLPLDQTLDGTLGIEVLEHTGDVVKGRLPVENRVRQPYGIVHGGAMLSLAESLTSMATAVGVMDQNMVAMGQEINASFMRPISAGYVNASARVRRRGRSAWVWEVEITDDADKLCSLIRATIAVRPARGEVAKPPQASALPG